MKKTYSELLKHPKWQKKRLEVMERSGFRCEICGSKEKTLHVHHAYYKKGNMPWEYPLGSLHCLCELCHSEVTELTNDIKDSIGSKSPHDLSRILGYVKCLDARNDPRPGLELDGDAEIKGAADYFGTTPEDLKNKCQCEYEIGEIDGINFWIVE